MDEAEAALAGLPEDKAGDPAIAKAKAGIALAKDAAPVDDFDALLAEVAASPDDHEKRFALAAGHVARGDRDAAADALLEIRSEEHTSELQSLMRISYAVFCLKKKNNITVNIDTITINRPNSNR